MNIKPADVTAFKKQNINSFTGFFSSNNKKLLKQALKGDDLNLLSKTLEPITSPKKIKQVLKEDFMPGFEDPTTNYAFNILMQPNKLKIISNKLKSLKVEDPLNEIINHANIGIFGYFPERLVGFLSSLLEKNKNLVSIDSSKQLKRLTNHIIDPEFMTTSKKVCDDLKSLSQKLFNQVDE